MTVKKEKKIGKTDFVARFILFNYTSMELYEPMLELYIKIFKDKGDFEIFTNTELEEKTDGCTYPKGMFDGDKLCYVMWVEGDKLDIFIHELYHLVSVIDSEYSLGEETCAYLMGWIIREYKKSDLFI